MKKSFNVLIIAIAIVAFSCKKNTAGFTLDKYEYSAGEQLAFTNLSNGKIWTVKNTNDEIQATLDGRNPQYILSLKTEDGAYELGLFKNQRHLDSDDGLKKQFIVKTIKKTIKIKGYDLYENIEVFIDEESFGHSDEDGILECHVPVGIRIIKVIVNGTGKTKSVTADINLNGTDTFYFHQVYNGNAIERG